MHRVSVDLFGSIVPWETTERRNYTDLPILTLSQPGDSYRLELVSEHCDGATLSVKDLQVNAVNEK